MQCLACNQTVTWHKPVVWLGYDRVVHLDEFVSYLQANPLIEGELLREKERLVK